MRAGYDDLWGIGELAARAGVTVKTVRFYSDRGLLPETSRSAGGHRRYGSGALDRLRLIRSLRALGLSVAEVRRVLDDEEASGGVGEALEGAVAERLRELGDEMRTLRWREAALRLVQESTPEDRADRLHLIGELSVPPGTAPLVRFWRGWLPPRMPRRSVDAFLDIAVPQPPEDPAPEQVLAFARLTALTLAPCPGTAQPQPEAHGSLARRGAGLLRRRVHQRLRRPGQPAVPPRTGPAARGRSADRPVLGAGGRGRHRAGPACGTDTRHRP